MRRTLVDRARLGDVWDVEVSLLDVIADWHECPGDLGSLAEWLGWTEDEYEAWLAGDVSATGIVASYCEAVAA